MTTATSTGPGATAPTDDASLDNDPALDEPLDPAAALAALDWPHASQAADRVAQALAADLAPDLVDVTVVLGFTALACRVAEELSAAVGRPVVAGRAPLADALEELRSADETGDLLARLGAASGPAHVEASVATVRDLAVDPATVEDEALTAALVCLARLALACTARKKGDEVDWHDVSTWDSQARAGLPAQASMAITAATMGDLNLPATAPAPAPAPAPAEDVPAEPAPLAAAHEAEDSDATDGVPAQPGSPNSDAAAPDDDLLVTNVPEQQPEAPAQAATTAPELPNAPADDAPPAIPVDEKTSLHDPAPGPQIVEQRDQDPVTTPRAASLEELRAAALADLASPKARSLRLTTRPVNEPVADAHETQPEPEAEPVVDPYADLHLLEADLLSRQRYGLASHLHAEPAHRAAREMAAWQQHLTAPAGELAAAFAAAAAHVNRDDLADDRPGQILAWASALRVSVLAPAVGSAAVLGDLSPYVAGSRALTDVGEAFTRAALAGAIAIPALSDLDDAETQAHAHATHAQQIVDNVPHTTFKYVPAGGVYQKWLEPTGLLGSVLRTVAKNNVADVADVLASVTALRGNVVRNIDATFSAQRKRTRKDKIIAGARGGLISSYDDILDICQGWAEHAAAGQEHRDRIRVEQRGARPMENLRRDLTDLREQAVGDLHDMASACAPNSAEAGAYLSAALMLTDAFATVDGHPPTGPEPDPQWVLNHEFLLTDLGVDPITYLPADDQVSEAVTDLAGRDFDAHAAYQARAARGEHHLTKAMVDNLTVTDATVGEKLRELRAHDVTDAQQRLRDRVEETESLLRLHQRDATLPTEIAGTLTARAAGVGHSASRNFPELEAVLDDIVREVNDQRRTQVDAARTRLADAAQTNQNVATHTGLLSELIDAGEVAVALEYLEQLTTHGRLPEPHDESVQFSCFFPTVPDLATATPDLLAQMYASLGDAKPTAAVQALCAAAESDLGQMPPAAKQAAHRALGAWASLANPKGQRVDIKGALRAVLGLAGFEFAELAGAPRTVAGQPGRTWVKLSGVSAVGRALSPMLGSQMSKDGATLRLLVVTKPTAPATLLDWAGSERPEDTVVVLHLPSSYSTADRRALANASRGRPRPPVVVIDPAVMAFLATQHEPSRATLAALVLPFTADSPYQDRAGRTAPEMFYGRASERREVIDLEGPSFVSGGRQLGKSALLWSARDEFDNGTTRRAVLAEIRVVGGSADPDQVWGRVMAALVEGGVLRGPAEPGTVGAESVTSAIRSWLDENTERRLLILLDEADLFLEADAEQLFPHIGACKNLMDATDRRVKFVFAGLHRTARFESLANQPLAHLGRPIVVGPLRPQAAHDLLTRPLTALGYQFADPRTQPARVLAFTNNVPSLLQLFGRSLVRHLTSRNVESGPPSIITDDDITSVMDDTNLQTAFRDKYLLTLHLDHRYLVIVYAIAHQAMTEAADAGVTLTELEALCREWWPEGFADVNIDHLRGLAAECCDLGVLAFDRGRYRMRTQTMLQLLGTADMVEETLYAAGERLRLPSGGDAESHRVPMADTQHPGPFTARQVASLFSPEPKVLVVAGSSGTGSGWVTSSLEQMRRSHLTRGVGVRRLQNATAEGLRALLSKLSAPEVVVVDRRRTDPNKVADLVAAALDAVASPGAVATVVIVVDHFSAPAWADSEHLLELRRVDPAGIRLWCEETGSRFHTPEDYQALLDATSGWPRLLTVTIEKDNADTSPAAVLESLTASLSVPSRARDLVVDAGLGGDDPISALLRHVFVEVCDLTGNDTAPLDVLAELVADVDYLDTTIGQAAAALGFTDPEDLLVALRAAGAFRPDSRGHLVADPVLASAVTVASGAGQ